MTPTHYTSYAGPVESLAPRQSPAPPQDAMTTAELLRWLEPSREEWLAVLEVASEMQSGRAGTRGARSRRKREGPIGRLGEKLHGTEKRQRRSRLARLLLRVHSPIPLKPCRREGCDMQVPAHDDRDWCSRECRDRMRHRQTA